MTATIKEIYLLITTTKTFGKKQKKKTFTQKKKNHSITHCSSIFFFPRRNKFIGMENSIVTD